MFEIVYYLEKIKANDVCILKQIVQETKNEIEILIGQTLFKLWIKTVKMLL